MLLIALSCKLCIENLDDIISGTSAITLEESTYVPFQFDTDVKPLVESKASSMYPIKKSEVNWKAQMNNVGEFQTHVREYLVSADYACIHARHFGVGYDIIVFKYCCEISLKYFWQFVSNSLLNLSYLFCNS